jgi:type VI protein secretion system component VasK
MRINMILPGQRSRWLAFAFLGMLFHPAHAHASLFKGEALDKVAEVMSWVVLVIAPIIAITVFWLVHILPEKIAEKKQHPQAKAIQTLCLLSLVFGGMLWPLAWIWAYSKPVMYKLAYGTDKVAHDHDDPPKPSPDKDEEELKQLRKRMAELESKQAGKSALEGEKA